MSGQLLHKTKRDIAYFRPQQSIYYTAPTATPKVRHVPMTLNLRYNHIEGAYMELTYEQGNRMAPRGHAIVYFKQTSHTNLFATYIVVLPTSIDMVKYMPPFLAPHLSGMDTHNLTAFAFPPVPDIVTDPNQMRTLAEARGDDLLFGGEIDPQRIPDMLGKVNDIVQSYADAYATYAGSLLPTEDHSSESVPPGLGVNEVIYELMSDQDRLAELAKLVGQLRFAVEGGDQVQIEDMELEISTLGKHLPDESDISALILAAKDSTRSGGDLAQLYLERCFRLAEGDSENLACVDRRILAFKELNGITDP